MAVETVGNWYRIVSEIEQAGCRLRLVHAGKAKLMLGEVNKTDKLDARGLNKLQRTGTLPEVWIPPGELRDKRELLRTRMVLVREDSASASVSRGMAASQLHFCKPSQSPSQKPLVLLD